MNKEYMDKVSASYMEGLTQLIGRERTATGVKKSYVDLPGATELQQLSGLLESNAGAFANEFNAMKKNGRLALIVKGNGSRKRLTDAEKFVESFAAFTVKHDSNSEILSAKYIVEAYSKFLTKVLSNPTPNMEMFTSNRIFSRLYSEADEAPMDVDNAGADEEEQAEQAEQAEQTEQTEQTEQAEQTEQTEQTEQEKNEVSFFLSLPHDE